jgi:hypothetical protein
VRVIGTVVRPLNTPPVLGATAATCVDRRGRVAGYGSDGQFVSPLLWPALGGQEPVVLPTLSSDAAILGCSPLGLRAGYVIAANGDFHCAIWDPAGQISDQPTLGDGFAACFAVNDAGIAVGGALEEFVELPVRWVHGQIEILPLVEGADAGEASAINTGGDIVGTQWSELFPEGRATLTTSDRQVYDLNDLLVTFTPGLLLHNATGINTGGAITADGVLSGAPHGFLLVPMAPSHVTLTR